MQHPIILLLTAALLAGCGSKTNPTPTDAKIQWGKQDVAAVAFVGYFTYASDFLASSTYKIYTEQYGLQDVQLVENKGDEIYLVIPRDPKASVAVNDYPEALMTDPDSDDYGQILYKSEDGKPFFIKCSSAKGRVNTELLLIDSEGKGLTYHPQISTTDGTLACPSAMPEGEGTVIDITLPVPASQLPQETNRPDDNLSAFIRNGRVMVSVKQAAGSRNDGIYAIEGINGKCIGLFTGDIGQETNPFLCMLMDDGGVELLNYHSVMGWSDIEPGHLLSSGRQPEMTDIVSFVQKPVFDVFEGDTIGGYITVFAIDKDGKEHEIQECTRSFPSLYHFNPSGDGSTEEHVLTIWPDWKIEYRNGWHESERNEDYFGRIRPLKMDYENETYEYQYEMLTHTQYLSVEEDPVTKNISITGSFRLKERPGESGYELTVLSGPLTFGAPEDGSVYYGRNPEPDETCCLVPPVRQAWFFRIKNLYLWHEFDLLNRG